MELFKRLDDKLDEYRFPGAPLLLTVAIDLANGEQLVDGREVKDWQSEVAKPLLNRVIGMRRACVGGWLNEPTTPSHKEILEAPKDDFYVQDENPVRFYLAVCAIWNAHRDGYLWACYNEECDYVEAEWFATLEDAQAWMKENYPDEEE